MGYELRDSREDAGYSRELVRLEREATTEVPLHQLRLVVVRLPPFLFKYSFDTHNLEVAGE